MKSVKVVAAAFIVISLVLVCAGCTVKLENATSNKTGPTGASIGNIPVFPQAVRTSYVNNRIVGLIATYDTNDSAKNVTAFYKSEMQNRGYNITTDLSSSDQSGTLLIFTKDNDKVYITVGESSTRGNASIAVKASYQT